MGKSPAYQRDIDMARQEGHKEGLNQGRQEILDWLEHAYMDPATRPDRGSPEGEAILKVAQDAANHFRPLVKTKKGGRRK